MSRPFSTESPLFSKLSTLADLVLLNLLTILCSLPVITAGASITALYYTMFKLRSQESNLYRSFFKSFKENFKQSTIIWLVLLVVGALICMCALMYRQMNMPILLACTLLGLFIWGVVISWVFPLLSRFYSTTLGTLRNAVLFGTSYFLLSVSMTLVNLIPLVVFLFIPSFFIYLAPLWLCIWFSFAAYCNTGLLKIPFSAVIEREEANEDDAEEAVKT